ncbi:MAG TPA: hypothetical protein VK992_04005 [Candidatus Caenarcaniphilales bacterium]|nr:hypothetical protein [Candidatus Caenarcaniphilales bacterium]
MDVYLELGKKRVFAAAIDWPGWSRSGRDEEAALQALLGYGGRYAAVVHGVDPRFAVAADANDLHVLERLAGNATTDFGALGAIPDADWRPIDETELARLESLLRASWNAFDRAVDAGATAQLRPGPRGGGRSVAKMRAHVFAAEASYLATLGGVSSAGTGEASDDPELIRRAFTDALRDRVQGEIREVGPRGGVRWPPRYAVRRAAWHALDHAWEIEDRSIAHD